MRVPPPLTWQQWKINHQYELQHIAGYEEAFVDNILSQLYGVSPNDVIPQYHFIDVRGNNRYIDFMIINENKGWLLPIELDGFAKLHDYGSSYDHFQDMLYRQNEIIMKFGSILRFTNKDMYQDKKRTLAQISKKLKEQATLYEQKSLVKVETKVIEKIVEKPVTIIRHIEVEKPIEVYVDRPVEVIKYIEPPKPIQQPLPKPQPKFIYQNLETPTSVSSWRNWYKYYDVDKGDFFVEEVFKKLKYNRPSMFALKHIEEDCIIVSYTPTYQINATLIFCDEFREGMPAHNISFWLRFSEDDVYNDTDKVIKTIDDKIMSLLKEKPSFMDKLLLPFRLIGKFFGLINQGLTSLESGLDKAQDDLSRQIIQDYKTRINNERDYAKRLELKYQLEDYRKRRGLSTQYVDSIEPKLLFLSGDLADLEKVLKDYDIK